VEIVPNTNVHEIGYLPVKKPIDEITDGSPQLQGKTTNEQWAIEGEIAIIEKDGYYTQDCRKQQKEGLAGEQAKYATGVGNMDKPEDPFLRYRLSGGQVGSDQEFRELISSQY
jgi:hypothetical protein